MTLEQLKTMSNNLVQAIHDYTQEKDFDSIELERTLDELLCRLPRDIIYVEWYDRSDIEYTARQVKDDDRTGDKITDCMYELWNYNDNIMDNDIVNDIIEQTIKGE